ncbi:hypothetical protein ACWC5I_39575 [Kitasatospora sp. NPDC001574]
MIDIADLRLLEIVEEAAATVTDDIGRLRKVAFEDEVYDQLMAEDLDARVRSAAVRKTAKALVRGFGDSRSPKPRKNAGMFHPRLVLKLGGGVWVWMDRATPTDLLEWGRLSTRNLARVAIAEADRQDYVAERLDMFRIHTGFAHLGELERAVYGYIDSDAPFEDGDFGPESP